MHKTIRASICLCLSIGVLTGCSINDKKSEKRVETNTKNVVDGTKKIAKTAKDDVNDRIDNVMDYFKTKGVTYDAVQTIDDMGFAAYEGRSFVVDGKTIYLYRVKRDDPSMKKVIKEAQDKGKVRVRIDNKEQEYAAQVNGSYIMLYDSSLPKGNLQQLFPKYVANGVHGSDPNQDHKNGNTNPMTKK